MVLEAHQLKPAKGATKKRKRVGRGNSSGHGTYSTRGMKGQKSRSGVSGLKRLGMRQVLLRTPKQKGFKSPKPKYQVVNFSVITKNFKDSDTITPEALLAKKLISTTKIGVKILGDGKLELKNIRFKNVKISSSALEKIKDSSAKFEK